LIAEAQTERLQDKIAALKKEMELEWLGREAPLEKGMATHSSNLAWRIPWPIVHGLTKNWTQLSD